MSFFAHKGTFLGLGSRASLPMLKDALALDLKQGDKQASFGVFGSWLGAGTPTTWTVLQKDGPNHLWLS